MADTQDLKSCGRKARAGSTPASATNENKGETPVAEPSTCQTFGRRVRSGLVPDGHRFGVLSYLYFPRDA